MEAVYDRIIHNEIKMKDESLLGGGADAQKAAAAGAGWLDTIMNLLPGRAKAASAEPNDEAIRRTHEHLRWAALGRRGQWHAVQTGMQQPARCLHSCCDVLALAAAACLS